MTATFFFKFFTKKKSKVIYIASSKEFQYTESFINTNIDRKDGHR